MIDAFGVERSDISKGMFGSSYELHPDRKMNRKMNKARRKTNKTKPSSAHGAYSNWAQQLPARKSGMPYTESVGDAPGTEQAFSYFKHKYSDGNDDFGRPMVKPPKTKSVLGRYKKDISKGLPSYLRQVGNKPMSQYSRLKIDSNKYGKAAAKARAEHYSPSSKLFPEEWYSGKMSMKSFKNNQWHNAMRYQSKGRGAAENRRKIESIRPRPLRNI